MTPINKFLFWLVLLPDGLYKKMGIDTRQLKAIMSIKLLIDDRTPNTLMQLRRRKATKKLINGTSIWAVITSVIIGLGTTLMSFAYTENDIRQLSIYFSLYIILFALFLVSDFTSVLIDVRDNYVILPRPVSDKTLVMSRLLYIFIYLLKIAFPLLLPAAICIGVVYGLWASCIFILLSILVTAFTIFLVNTVYLVMIRITTPQKFQNIISYLQIAFGVITYGSYQILPRMLDKSKILDNIHPGNWKWVIPSYWFAGGWKFFSSFTFNAPYLICAGLSICIPLISMWLVIKYLVPSFNQKISLIAGSAIQENVRSKAGVTRKSKTRFSEKMAKLLTRKGPERMGYLFTWKMTARSRDYRLKVFPALGYMLVFFFILGYDIFRKTGMAGFSSSKRLLVSVIYITCFMLITAMAQIPYSEKFKASWIYHALPIKTPGQIISGAFKSIVVKFFLPFATVISIISIYFFGTDIIPNIILGEANQLFLCGVFTLFLIKDLPFSEEQPVAQRTRTLRSIGLFIVLAIVGGVHYLVFDISWAVYILTALSLTGTAFLVKGIRDVSWRELYNEE